MNTYSIYNAISIGTVVVISQDLKMLIQHYTTEISRSTHSRSAFICPVQRDSMHVTELSKGQSLLKIWYPVCLPHSYHVGSCSC